MLQVIWYVLATAFLAAAVYFAISGFLAPIKHSTEIQGYRRRAVRYSLGLFCCMASFEFLFPLLIVVLVGIPVVLLLIWTDYWVAAAIIRKQEQRWKRQAKDRD